MANLPLFQDSEGQGPLVLSLGMGVDSVAILVGWHKKGIRPDLILFADPGAEHKLTYSYMPILSAWLTEIGFPPITTVRYRPAHGRYETILQECLLKGILPSLAYGSKSCSQKWKCAPQLAYLKTWKPAIAAWSNGLRVRNAIGYDAGPRDALRGRENVDTDLTEFVYPLRAWNWDRARCIQEIESCETLTKVASKAGHPTAPTKSACVMCPSTHACELHVMAVDEPENLRAALTLEREAMPRLTSISGLWRKATKTRPGSWTEYATEQFPDQLDPNLDIASAFMTQVEAPEGSYENPGRFAVKNRGTVRFFTQFQDAVKAAGHGPLLVRIAGTWFESTENRLPTPTNA